MTARALMLSALLSSSRMKRIARLSCEGATAVARKRSAMSHAARAGSQAAQWTTPSRASQNIILSQRQHGLRSFTAVFVMAFSTLRYATPTRGHHCSEAARDGKSLKPYKLAAIRSRPAALALTAWYL